MTAAGDEKDERLTHRLEAFSDIVIGFSLAQLGLSLTLPAKPADLFAHPVGITAFIVTFAIVCRLWWSHHKLFSTVFVPKPLPVFLNFATLGVLLFSVYSVQLMTHFMTDRLAFVTYLGSFAALFLLMGAQYVAGYKLRGSSLPAAVARKSLADGIVMLFAGVGFAAGGAAIAIFGMHPGIAVPFVVIFLVTVRILRVALSNRVRRAQTA